MKLNDLFYVEICKNPISKDYALDNPGNTPYITTTAENNGIECYVNYPPQYDGGVITVSKDGGNGDAFLQHFPFCGNEKVMVLIPKTTLSKIELFYYVTVIKHNKSMFGYGRKCSVERLEALYIPSPQEIPDFIQKIKITPITTKNANRKPLELNTNKWEYFLLKDICSVSMGNKMDYSAMNTEEKSVNFVGRSAVNNGIAGKVDFVFDDDGNVVKPYKAGCITVALGGSLGATYLQTEDFYTSQNVAVLEFEDGISNATKLFITTCIMNESKYKYFPFGRELNTHIRTDFGFTLPIQRKTDGTPIIDKTLKYSPKGYIPDWQWMENYIKSLPYGERL